jgi:transposase
VGERRKFSREYKIGAIQPIIDGVKSLAQVSRELEIRRSLLQRWKQEYLSNHSEAFPGSGNLPPEAGELARLKRENRRLQQESEILKKALAIFSQGPPRGSV